MRAKISLVLITIAIVLLGSAFTIPGGEGANTMVYVTINNNDLVLECGSTVSLSATGNGYQTITYNGSANYTFQISGSGSGVVSANLLNSCGECIQITPDSYWGSWSWHNSINLTINVTDLCSPE